MFRLQNIKDFFIEKLLISYYVKIEHLVFGFHPTPHQQRPASSLNRSMLALKLASAATP